MRWIPAQRPVARSFDVFFDLRLNKQMSKQWWGWWFETLSRPLCRHCNDWAAWATLHLEWSVWPLTKFLKIFLLLTNVCCDTCDLWSFLTIHHGWSIGQHRDLRLGTWFHKVSKLWDFCLLYYMSNLSKYNSTHWPLGDADVISNLLFSNSYRWLGAACSNSLANALELLQS